MLSHSHYETMERDELVRLAGEQALLSKSLSTLRAEQERDTLAMRNILSSIGRSNDWYARGTELLQRIHEREQRLATDGEQLRNLSKLTGL